MLNGIHFLLTYMCNSECDHCFLYSDPRAKGTFTLKQIIPLSETTAIAKYQKNTGKYALAFFYWINMGDAMEGATRDSVGAGVYDQTEIFEEQLWLRERARRCHNGNA